MRLWGRAKQDATRPHTTRAGLALLVAIAVLARPQTAVAQGAQSYWAPGYGYGWGYGYGYDTFGMAPLPVVVPQGPPMLAIDSQFYELGVQGLRRLCAAHPDLCQDRDVLADLRGLQARRVAGITLAWSGVAAAILGPTISTAVNCAHTDGYCRPNTAAVLSTVLGGLAVSITGLILLPGNHDVIDVVNHINRAHPDHTIGLKMSLLAGEHPALALSGDHSLF